MSDFGNNVLTASTVFLGVYSFQMFTELPQAPKVRAQKMMFLIFDVCAPQDQYYKQGTSAEGE